MKKPDLQQYLRDNDVSFGSTDTVLVLEALARENNLPLTPTEDSDTVIVSLRPAPPLVENGDIVEVSGLDISDVTKHKEKPYLTAKARLKYGTDGEENGVFTPYSFKRANVVFPFIPDARFEKLYRKERLSSFRLVAEVLPDMVPATNWDEPRQGVIWHIEGVVSVKAQKRDRKDKFEEFIFDPKTFQSNPELLSKSGILNKIMEETV